MDIETAIGALRIATEAMERACRVDQAVDRGDDQMDRAVMERAIATDRLAAIIHTRDGTRDRAFSTADLAQLRELSERGASVLTAMRRARRTDCAAVSKIDRMRYVLDSFRPAE